MFEMFQSKLNTNRYATKKTIAQGMLDIALLSSNAAQLKYILTVSPAVTFDMMMTCCCSGGRGARVLPAHVGPDCLQHCAAGNGLPY